MADKSRRRLGTLKKAVEDFISRYYPEELAILPIVWQRFLKMLKRPGAPHKGVGSYGPANALWGLNFADTLRAQTAAVVVIQVLYTPLVELQTQHGQIVIPSAGDLNEALKTSARVINIPSELSERLADWWPGFLSTLMAQDTSQTVDARTGQKQVLSVSHEGTVQIDNGQFFQIGPPQTAILLPALIRSRVVHWLEGFVLFERWGRIHPKVPYKAFCLVISRLGRALSRRGVGLRIVRLKNGGAKDSGKWELKVLPGTEVTGNVAAAQRLVQLAKLERSNTKEGIRTYICQALELDPDSVEAALMLLEQADISSVDASLTDRAMTLAIREEQRLKTALKILDTFSKTWSSKWYASIADHTCAFERRRTRVSASIGKGRHIINAGNEAGEGMSDLLVLGALVKSITTDDSEGSATKAFLANKHVKAILNRALKECSRLSYLPSDYHETNTLARFLETMLTSQVSKWPSPVEYENLAGVKAGWARYLARVAVEEIIYETTGVDPNKQKQVRDYWATRGRLEKAGSESSREYLREVLGWSDEKLCEVEGDAQRMNPGKTLNREYSFEDAVIIESFRRWKTKRRKQQDL